MKDFGKTKLFCELLGERSDVDIVKFEIGDPLSADKVKKFEKLLPPELIEFLGEGNGFAFQWVHDAFKDDDVQTPGLHGGNFELGAVDDVVWGPCSEPWESERCVQANFMLDGHALEGYGSLVVSAGKNKQWSYVTWMDHNICESVLIGKWPKYIRQAVQGAFSWYWPRSGQKSKAMKALMKNSAGAKIPRPDLVDILVKKGTDRAEAEALAKWLGKYTRLLVEKGDL